MEVVAVENVDDVAAAFIAALGPLQTRKLQKLVYYAQAWNAARGQGPLFRNSLEAWMDGPVVRHLWDQHKYQGLVSSWTSGDPARLSERSQSLVAMIVERYGAFSGDELSALTHVETPWIQAREGVAPGERSTTSIPVTAMAEYYGRQVLSSEDAAAHARANAEIEGLNVSDDLECLLVKVSAGTVSADTAVAEYLARPVSLR